MNDNELLSFDAILTGYTSSIPLLENISESIKLIKKINSKALYFLDPVMGDNGNFYVPRELFDVYMNNLLPLADVIIPNQFEAEMMSNMKFTCLNDILTACKKFIFHHGVKVCVLKGIQFQDKEDLNVVIAIKSSNDDIIAYHKCLPRINKHFSGCGDVFSSLMVASIYNQYNSIITENKHYLLGDIIDQCTSIMSSILELTVTRESKDLCIIESSPIIIQGFHSNSNISPLSYLNNTYINEVGIKAKLVSGQCIGVIFDLDGTLTEAGAIDFKAMYNRIGLNYGNGDIVSQVEAMSCEDQRQNAYDIIEEEEIKALEKVLLRSDTRDCISILNQNKIKIAIATRNCHHAINHFFSLIELNNETNLKDHKIYPLIHRNSFNGVNKPDPQVALNILSSWNFGNRVVNGQYNQVWFVGDSIDDMKCGKDAGCWTCLLLTNENQELYTKYPQYIDKTASSLSEFLRYLNL